MLEVRAQNWAVAMRLKMAQEHEFRLPPPGVTKNAYSIAGTKYEVFTARCPNEGCWLVRERIPDEKTANEMLRDHQDPDHPHVSVPPCPAPPRRESLPSGLTHAQTLWNELDEVTDAIATQQPHRTMTTDRSIGFARGLAFAIVLLEREYFPDIESVARHAKERRDMRLGAREWQPTPSRWAPDARTADIRGLTPAPEQPGPRAAKPVSTASKPVAKPVNPDWIAAIKAGIGAGMFTPQEMADAYGITVEQVNQAYNS